jgi:TatD DNase family protein
VIDTHAHLDVLEDVEGVLARARAAGVTRIVAIGTGVDSSRRTLVLADAHEGIDAVVGIDPHAAGQSDAGRVDELRELLEHPRAVAVGETGLDYHYGGDRRSEQAQLFDAQLALAEGVGKPVVIHCRAAAADTAAALRPFGGTVILHCFSEPELLEPAVDRGYYVSFAGNVTFPRSSDLRDAAAAVPSERLLVETDAPYLAPQPVRGRRNEPANVRFTLAALADVRGEDAAALAALTEQNGTRAFGLR